jgi:hypothetical protein
MACKVHAYLDRHDRARHHRAMHLSTLNIIPRHARVTHFRDMHVVVRHVMVMLVRVVYEREIHTMVSYVSLRNEMPTHASGNHVRAMHFKI